MLSIALAASTPRGERKKKDGWLICFCKWGRRNHSGARRRSRVMRVGNLHRSCGARARRPRQLGQRQGGQIWGGEGTRRQMVLFFFFKHVITDYIFREETVKEATHVTFFFWCKGSKTHFKAHRTVCPFQGDVLQLSSSSVLYLCLNADIMIIMIIISLSSPSNTSMTLGHSRLTD